MVHGCAGWVAIAAKMLVEGDLLRVEQCTGFKVRRQMNRAQTTLQFSYRGRLGGKSIRCDLALLE
jgi:hypothetical protein